MKKHPTNIAGYATLEELAVSIGKLRYDKLSELLAHLCEEMERQRDEDERVGKIKLAYDTQWLIDELGEACDASHWLFEEYKKYMKDELK